jgi:hypothetical protein
MLCRFAVAAIVILAGASGLTRDACAAEPPALQVGEVLSTLGEAERARVAQALRRESFTAPGEMRRKGQIIVVTALQQGFPWRLVVDSVTGEIIGRRPLVERVAFPR